jgi:hypothetical protein
LIPSDELTSPGIDLGLVDSCSLSSGSALLFAVAADC